MAYMNGVPRRKPLLTTNDTYAHLISAKKHLGKYSVEMFWHDHKRARPFMLIAFAKLTHLFPFIFFFWFCPVITQHRSRTAGGGSGDEPRRWRGGEDGWASQEEADLQPDSGRAFKAQKAV